MQVCAGGVIVEGRREGRLSTETLGTVRWAEAIFCKFVATVCAAYAGTA